MAIIVAVPTRFSRLVTGRLRRALRARDDREVESRDLSELGSDSPGSRNLRWSTG
jgi:hypothetical protein